MIYLFGLAYLIGAIIGNFSLRPTKRAAIQESIGDAIFLGGFLGIWFIFNLLGVV